jgi:hypothetical protein
MSKRVYIKLWVYNYDRSPRAHWLQHNCKSIEHAQHLVKRLHSLQGLLYSDNRTGGWLMRNHNIDGFIEHGGIDGIYEETTEKIQ